jgi:hypothetical protein
MKNTSDFEERLFDSIGDVITSHLIKMTKQLNSYGFSIFVVFLILGFIFFLSFLIQLIMTCYMCILSRKREIRDKLKNKISKYESHQYYTLDRSQRQYNSRLNKSNNIQIPALPTENNHLGGKNNTSPIQYIDQSASQMESTQNV